MALFQTKVCKISSFNLYFDIYDSKIHHYFFLPQTNSQVIKIMKFQKYFQILQSTFLSGEKCSRATVISRWKDWMEIQTPYSKYLLRRDYTLQLSKTVLSFIGDMSRILSTSKLSKPFSRQCLMTVLDQKCFSKIRSLELSNFSMAVHSPFGKWEIPWYLRILQKRFATLILMHKHKRTFTLLSDLTRIIYLSIRS